MQLMANWIGFSWLEGEELGVGSEAISAGTTVVAGHAKIEFSGRIGLSSYHFILILYKEESTSLIFYNHWNNLK